MKGTPIHKHRNILIACLLTALAVIVGYYFIGTVNWSILNRIKPSLLGILVLIALLYMILNTFSTWLLFQGMGYSLSFTRLFLVITSSLSSNYITPMKAGIPIRLWLYKTILEIPFSSGSACLIIETSLGLIIGSIMSLLGTLLVSGENSLKSYVAPILVFIAFLGIFVSFKSQLLYSVAKNLIPSKHLIRIIQWGKKFSRSIKAIPLTTIVGIITLYLLRLYIRACCLNAVLKGVGATSSILELVLIQSISGLVGILSLLPMGIGVKDVSLTVLMMQLGVPRDVALIGVLIDRSLWTIVPFVTGIVTTTVLGISGLAENYEPDSIITNNQEQEDYIEEL